MPQSVWKIVVGLLLALVMAAALSLLTGLPIGSSDSKSFLATMLPIAAYALPGAIAIIALAEMRHIRGLLFYILAGLLLATLGFIALTRHGAPLREAVHSFRSYQKFALMGSAGGWVYWLIAGQYGGSLIADFARLSDSSHGEFEDRKRCRICWALSLILGFLPLSLLGWYAFHGQNDKLVAGITEKAEADAETWLRHAGLQDTKLTIANHVGHVTGHAPDNPSKSALFERARSVLAPMVGKPGIFEYLQNDISVPDTVNEALDPTKQADDAAAARAKADVLKRLAEERRKQDDLSAQKKDDAERARLAAEARKLADEQAAAKAKAEDEERKEAESRAIAEAKKRAEVETAAKAKADEARRIEAETNARRIAEAEARQKAETEATIRAMALEEARRNAEAEAERRAVEAAHKAAEVTRSMEEKTPQLPAPTISPVDPFAHCGADFSDLFRSFTVRFGFNSADLGDDSSRFLDQVAQIAKGCSNLAVTVDGHADRRGRGKINDALSRARSETVRNALISRGLDAGRIVASGYGAERPFDPANTRAAYAMNRRVDFGVKPYQPLPAPTAPRAGRESGSEKTTDDVSKFGPLPAGACGGEFSRLFLSGAVRFDFMSSDINKRLAGFLDRVAETARRCPSYTLYLDGHTDRRGDSSYNQQLSEARAMAVRKALMARNVPAARLVARGYGGERPLVPANTRKAFALNRRVDFGVAEKTSAKAPSAE